MILQFTTYEADGSAVPGNHHVESESIVAVTEAIRHRTKVAMLFTSVGPDVLVDDENRTAAKRWAEAKGETIQAEGDE